MNRSRILAPSKIEIIPIRNNVYMLAAPGGNSTVQIGEDGVLVVDTMSEANASSLLATINTLSPKPIRWIVNTHVHRDHTGGNAERVRGPGGGAEITRCKLT